MSDQTNFADLLALEAIEQDIFRGRCHVGAPLRTFGGQVAAQALVAAGRSVAPERPVHSLHGYFLRPGNPDAPIVYLVERLRDGTSFTTRRVTAVQDGVAIFTLSSSFQVPEVGDLHQRPMPPAPEPDGLAGGPLGHWPVMDLRFVPAPPAPAGGVPAQMVWMRSVRRLPDDPLLQVCAMAYFSDLTLAMTADLDHAHDPGQIFMASLDHAMWFHHPFRADDWLLFVQESPSLSGHRGLARGEFFTRSGLLVASAVQEAVIRRR